MKRGLELSQKAKILRPVLECWLTNFEQACFAFPQTKRAWFTEPTLVGLLSSASWQTGLRSIVEAKAIKPGAKDPKLDLLIQGPEGGLAFEAKIHFIPEENKADRISQRLKKALGEASSVSHPQADRYFGIVFALMEGVDPNTNLCKVLDATIQHAKNRHPSLDALAWILLDQPGVIYRGCVLACQETDPPNNGIQRSALRR